MPPIDPVGVSEGGKTVTVPGSDSVALFEAVTTTVSGEPLESSELFGELDGAGGVEVVNDGDPEPGSLEAVMMTVPGSASVATSELGDGGQEAVTMTVGVSGSLLVVLDDAVLGVGAWLEEETHGGLEGQTVMVTGGFLVLVCGEEVLV